MGPEESLGARFSRRASLAIAVGMTIAYFKTHPLHQEPHWGDSLNTPPSGMPPISSVVPAIAAANERNRYTDAIITAATFNTKVDE